jgi:hypothetical protein
MTDGDGKFEMQLPPGKYTLTFSGEVQARAATFSQEVTVPPLSDGPLQQAFTGR